MSGSPIEEWLRPLLDVPGCWFAREYANPKTADRAKHWLLYQSNALHKLGGSWEVQRRGSWLWVRSLGPGPALVPRYTPSPRRRMIARRARVAATAT